MNKTEFEELFEALLGKTLKDIKKIVKNAGNVYKGINTDSVTKRNRKKREKEAKKRLAEIETQRKEEIKLNKKLAEIDREYGEG